MPDLQFTDPKLNTFRQQFVDHKKEFTEHVANEDKRFGELLIAQEQNTAAIDRLINETRVIVQLQHDIHGAYTIGVGVQRFGVWLIKWPLIGTGAYAAYAWVLKHFP